MKLDDVTDSPLPLLPPRAPDSHKGNYGHALLVGGSTGMSGAIAMAGLATLRSGAGLVTLAVPRPVLNVVASFSPCYMTQGLADHDGQFTKAAAADVLELGHNATAMALGPGLGRSDVLVDFVEVVHSVVHKPMVIDADALFAFSKRVDSLPKAGGPRILTPHAGEFYRLTGHTFDDATRIEAAAQFARGEDDLHYEYRSRDGNRPQMIVVIKGHRTVITDGERYAVNQTGNPGMATGGSGDVLTGVITALLCQGLSPFDAARLGAHVHGLAGDLAALELGQVSLIATDIIDYLPQAFQAIGG